MNRPPSVIQKIKSTSVWERLSRHCLSPLAEAFHDYILNARGKLLRRTLPFTENAGEHLRRHGFQPFCSSEIVRLAAIIREDISIETIEATKAKMRERPHGLSARRGVIPLDLSIETKIALLKFATSDDVLEPIISYLGVVPKLHHIGATLTTPDQCSGQEHGSEKWHRDGHVYRSPTLFIYLTDVDEGSGPFHLISKDHLGHAAILPIKPSRRSEEANWDEWHRERFSDAEINRYVAESSFKKILGPAGTGFFIDQGALYHKGGYSIAKERILFQINYVTEAKYDQVSITPLFESLSDKDKAQIRTNSLIDYMLTPSITVLQKMKVPQGFYRFWLKAVTYHPRELDKLLD